MLAIPEKYFCRSSKKINVSTIPLGDWLEGSLLFADERISKTDVVDILTEQEICKSQDIAFQIADLAWDELRRRQKLNPNPKGYFFERNSVERLSDWEKDPIRAFFVTLSLFPLYPKWAEDWRDPETQGDLFERISEKLFVEIFPGWKILRTGWSPKNPRNLKEIIDEVKEELNFLGAPNLEEWTKGQENDGELDIVCYRDFEDGAEAQPVYFIQCASGGRWERKLKEPDPKKWFKYLDAASPPSTGICIPFIIDNKEIRISGLNSGSFVLDRIRLLKYLYEKKLGFEKSLRMEILNWLKPKLIDIPKI